MASAEQRRLYRILLDEDYGPKLARLNRADERKVLDLIERNQGRDARRLIVELDAKRREKLRASAHKRTLAARVKEFLSKEPVERSRERPVDETREFWELYDSGVLV